MVPHDARRLSENDDDLDIFTLTDYQDPLLPKNERFNESQSHQPPSPTQQQRTDTASSPSGLFGDDLEIKPEIDTGTVSESCFSFKKLWKYTGPGLFYTSNLI